MDRRTTVNGGQDNDALDGDNSPNRRGLPTLDPNPNLDRYHGAEGDDTAVNCEQVTSAD